MNYFTPDRNTLIAVMMLFCGSVFGQATSLSIAKKWSYAGYEEFGVVRPPAGNTTGDYLNLDNDGSYRMIQEGKESSGSWVLNEKSGIITLTNAQSKKKITYTIKKTDDNLLIVEYQSPDLVRTKYHYTVK